MTRQHMGDTINRYSVGDRTKGLIYGKDGSLTIYVGNASPSKALKMCGCDARSASTSLTRSPL